MKLIVTSPDGIVLSKSDTNLISNTETPLIEVGSNNVILVDDSDTHSVGDVFKAS